MIILNHSFIIKCWNKHKIAVLNVIYGKIFLLLFLVSLVWLSPCPHSISSKCGTVENVTIISEFDSVVSTSSRKKHFAWYTVGKTFDFYHSILFQLISFYLQMGFYEIILLHSRLMRFDCIICSIFYNINAALGITKDLK